MFVSANTRGRLAPARPAGREPTLDGIRGVAIILVYLGHLVPYMAPFSKPGVTVFFGLSGYLITRLLITERGATGAISLRRFYIRRFFRLAPAFLLVLTSIVVWCLVLGVFTRRLIPDSLVALLYVSNWYITDPDFTYPMRHLWSLSVEEQFYLLWPILVVIVGSRLRRLTLMVGLAAAASLGIGVALALHGSVDITYRSDTAALLLLLGCGGALLEKRGSLGWTDRLGAFPLAAAVLFVPVAYFVMPSPWVDAVVEPMVAAGAVIAAIGARNSRILRSRVFVWAGLLSYSLYLWQTPVRFNGLGVGPGGESPAWIVLPISISLAWLTWRFVERPARVYGRRLAAKSRPEQAPAVASSNEAT